MARLFFLWELYRAAAAEDLLEEQRENRDIRAGFSTEHYDEAKFVSQYRLTPALFKQLMIDLNPILGRPKRSDAISNEAKVLTALSFYATGKYQNGLADNAELPMAQQTVSNVIRKVTRALNDRSIVRKYVRFPQNKAERNKIKEGFSKRFGMPGVIGCLEGSHVAVIRPREESWRYLNNNKFHSIKLQLVCDSNNQILNMDASFPGNTPVNYILSKRTLLKHMLELAEKGEHSWLLGDRSYSQTEFLMTPIEEAEDGSPEANYNEIHERAWRCARDTSALLRRRWQCLLVTNDLHYDPASAARIVNACCMLHNLCNRQTYKPTVPTFSSEQLKSFARRAVTDERYELDLPKWSGEAARKRLVQMLYS